MYGTGGACRCYATSRIGSALYTHDGGVSLIVASGTAALAAVEHELRSARFRHMALVVPLALIGTPRMLVLGRIHAHMAPTHAI